MKINVKHFVEVEGRQCVRFSCVLGEAWGFWFGDKLAVVDSEYFVEFDVHEGYTPFEIVQADSDLYSISDGTPAAGQYSVRLRAKIVHHWTDYGLYQLDLCDGTIAIEQSLELSVGDWIQVVVPSLLLWPYEL